MIITHLNKFNSHYTKATLCCSKADRGVVLVKSKKASLNVPPVHQPVEMLSWQLSACLQLSCIFTAKFQIEEML
jgi:hypothetical protein